MPKPSRSAPSRPSPTDLTSLEQLQEAIDPIAEHAHQRLLRDGRGARTVTVKLKNSDMSTLTRSATLPYATTEAGALVAVARRLLLDPREIGPIRLLGVGFSGLSEVRQESLFPDLEFSTLERGGAPSGGDGDRGDVCTGSGRPARWRIGDDVAHRGFRARLGAGRGPRRGHRAVRDPRVGPGPARTFAADDAELTSANPVDSLDWPDYVGALQAGIRAEASAPAGDDVADG